jgi:hypothetical protein
MFDALPISVYNLHKIRSVDSGAGNCQPRSSVWPIGRFRSRPKNAVKLQPKASTGVYLCDESDHVIEYKGRFRPTPLVCFNVLNGHRYLGCVASMLLKRECPLDNKQISIVPRFVPCVLLLLPDDPYEQCATREV